MATVQHPAFESDTRIVDDPAPWIEQGWILLDEAAGPVEVPGVEVPADVIEVPADVVESVEVPETPADDVAPAPRPGPRNKR